MYPQGVCRIRKPACAGNGCAIFPIFQTADWGQKIRYPAADDLFRVSLDRSCHCTPVNPYPSLPLGKVPVGRVRVLPLPMGEVPSAAALGGEGFFTLSVTS